MTVWYASTGVRVPVIPSRYLERNRAITITTEAYRGDRRAYREGTSRQLALRGQRRGQPQREGQQRERHAEKAGLSNRFTVDSLPGVVRRQGNHGDDCALDQRQRQQPTAGQLDRTPA